MWTGLNWWHYFSMKQGYWPVLGHAHTSGAQGQWENRGWMTIPALISSSPWPGTAAPLPVHGKKPPGPAEGPACETQDCVLSVRSNHSLSLSFMVCCCDPRHSSVESGSDFDPWEQESKHLKVCIVSSISQLSSALPSLWQGLVLVLECSCVQLLCWSPTYF